LEEDGYGAEKPEAPPSKVEKAQRGHLAVGGVLHNRRAVGVASESAKILAPELRPEAEQDK
jgi:hypothetical protein